MLVFIDESGDTGLKIEKGASRFFVIALMIFEDHDEAIACDQRIQLLKKELGYPPDFEFHFYNNSDKVRRKFLEATAPYSFFFLPMVINKNPKKLYGEGFQHKTSFYKFTCGLVFENAKPYLKNAIVKVDKSGNELFRSELAKYLKKKVNQSDHQLIKSVKMERSSSNNLLQLADYIAGVVNRKVQEKKNSDDYFRFIAHKAIGFQVWPK